MKNSSIKLFVAEKSGSEYRIDSISYGFDSLKEIEPVDLFNGQAIAWDIIGYRYTFEAIGENQYAGLITKVAYDRGEPVIKKGETKDLKRFDTALRLLIMRFVHKRKFRKLHISEEDILNATHDELLAYVDQLNIEDVIGL